jgi:apolipoprotein N-acyltransferase
VRRLREGVPVLVGVATTLAFPPVGLVWAGVLLWRRARTGSTGVTLAWLSRSGRRAFAWLAGIGVVAVSAAYVSGLSGHGGASFGPVVATIVGVALLALVLLDAVLGASIVVADAAERQVRRRRGRRGG